MLTVDNFFSSEMLTSGVKASSIFTVSVHNHPILRYRNCSAGIGQYCTTPNTANGTAHCAGWVLCAVGMLFTAALTLLGHIDGDCDCYRWCKTDNKIIKFALFLFAQNKNIQKPVKPKIAKTKIISINGFLFPLCCLLFSYARLLSSLI